MEKKEKDGFWVRIWMEHGSIEEDYLFLLFEEGYEIKDEESLKSLAYEWAQYDKHGADHDRYRFGYEIIDKPPIKWLKKEMQRLSECKEKISEKIEFIGMEISRNEGMIK